MKSDFQICINGIWDTTVPGITFDKNGVSNYVKMYEKLEQLYPRGEEGLQNWKTIAQRMKEKGKGEEYNCIIGISGGTDSSYLLHLACEYGLRPLAVNIDNGWNTDMSVENIKKLISKLNIDLETYVVDPDEMNDILVSYMKAGLPWIDGPSDHAIKSILYKTAYRNGIKYILSGGDFRSEGKQPSEWTYSDVKQLKYIQNRFGRHKVKTFPYLTIKEMVYLSYIKGIKVISPYNYLDYQKKTAQAFLTKKYGWEYYGGHHHENIFTKFVIGYWLTKKFNIDKRIITLSAQILSGEITRQDALEELKKPPYDRAQIEEDKNYIIGKLGLTQMQFKEVWRKPNKYFMDYPSNYPTIKKYMRFIKPILKYVLHREPLMFAELEMRNEPSLVGRESQ